MIISFFSFSRAWWPFTGNAIAVKENTVAPFDLDRNKNELEHCTSVALKEFGNCNEISDDESIRMASKIGACFILKAFGDDSFQCSDSMSPIECSIQFKEKGYADVYITLWNSVANLCWMGQQDQIKQRSTLVQKKMVEFMGSNAQSMQKISDDMEEQSRRVGILGEELGTTSDAIKKKLEAGFDEISERNRDIVIQLESVQANLTKGIVDTVSELQEDVDEIKKGQTNIMSGVHSIENNTEHTMNLTKELADDVKLFEKKLTEAFGKLESMSAEMINKSEKLMDEMLKNTEQLMDVMAKKNEDMKQEIQDFFNPLKVITDQMNYYANCWGDAIYYFASFIAILFLTNHLRTNSTRGFLVLMLLVTGALDKYLHVTLAKKWNFVISLFVIMCSFVTHFVGGVHISKSSRSKKVLRKEKVRVYVESDDEYDSE
jgi:hypothetical protein